MNRGRPIGWITGAVAVALTLGALAPLQAQQTTFHGQVRPRLESRDPSGAGSDVFTSMRVRFGVDAQIEENLSIFVQAQDVRIWGEETHPLFDYRADNLDLHQAWFRYRGEELEWLTATVGRIETAFGGQRLVGAVNWLQQGQSFDGVRLDLDGDPGSVALIAYTLGDVTAPTASENRQLYGAYATREDVGPGDLDAYWLYARANAETETNEHSLGARYVFGLEGLSARVEGTLQTGTRAGADVSAFMVGARVGTTFADGRGSVTAWYDYLSGDDPDTPGVEVFNTLYGTNHKFYGFADLFTNIPVHTGGAGLQDLAAKLASTPWEGVTANLDLHSFRAAERGALSGSHFADELDVTVTHRYGSGLGVSAGFSYVVQDDALGEVGRLAENQTWFFVMFDASF